MTIRSPVVIVDAEEYGSYRAGVTEFNNFGVPVSSGVVVADLGVVEGDDDLFKMVSLVRRLVLVFFLLLLLSFVMVCIVYFLMVILIVFEGFVTFLFVFWTFETEHIHNWSTQLEY